MERKRRNWGARPLPHPEELTGIDHDGTKPSAVQSRR
jgi:hypothetical protein